MEYSWKNDLCDGNVYNVYSYRFLDIAVQK